MMVKNKKAQQEMVGFVLIIVLVVVAVLVLLLISARKPVEPIDSVDIANLLSSMTKYTTKCADYEPNYYDVRELVRACFKNEGCENSDVDSCVYLEEVLRGLVESSVKTESTLSYYGLDVSTIEENGVFGESVVSFSEGNCTGDKFSGEQVMKIGFEDISFRMKFCKN